VGYALVGSAGAVNNTTSGAPNTPAFGQATTAGNLLAAWMFSNSSSGTNPFSTSATGWTLATTGGGAFAWTAIYYRANCGAGETPPTFNTGGTFGYVGLAEFSGGATASPLDQSVGINGSPPGTATNPAADAAGGDLILLCVGWNGGNPGPTTITTAMTDSTGASVTPAQSDNHTSSGSVFYDFAWGFAGSSHGASADTAAGTLGVFSGGGAALASFKPASGVAHTATASLTVTPSFSAARTRGHSRTASLTVTPGFSAARTHGHSRTGSLTVTPGFSAARTRARFRTGSLTVTPGFSASRVHGHGRTAALSVVPGFSTARTHGHARGAALAVTPAFTTARVHAQVRHAALTVTPSLHVTAVRTVPGTGTLFSFGDPRWAWTFGAARNQ
jgi:hypothetical protein